MANEPPAVPAELEAAVTELVAQYKQAMPAHLVQMQTGRAESDARLRALWWPAFDLYDLCAIAAFNAGSEFNERHREQAMARQDFVFEVLMRLHTRACLTASEVRALLFTGHPLGALARWRTLHELAVVAHFIHERGGDVAERFLKHERIDEWRWVKDYDEAATSQGLPSVDPETMTRLTNEHDALCQQFGRGFDSDYGWAAHALKPESPNHRPSFKEVEANVDLAGARPFYREASQGIHSGAAGAGSHIFITAAGRVHVAGPTNVGLARPGSATLMALLQCTTAFLLLGPEQYSDDSQVVVLYALGRLIGEANAMFYAVEDALEVERQGREAEAKRRRSS